MSGDKSTSSTVSRAAETLRDKLGPISPQIGLVLGSGLGWIADHLSDSTRVAYADIEGMPECSVKGHPANLIFGTSEATPVVAMQGRLHLYEGHDPEQVVFGVRLMLSLGAPTLIVTNAAGGIRADMQPGDLMLIDDHINLTGCNPLSGPEKGQPGERFVDMTGAYDPLLRTLAREAAATLRIPLTSGVYAGLVGPSYETPAEIRMLRALGADAVGMSTVLEVIAARQMQARVLGICCISNRAAGLAREPLDHDRVQAVAQGSSSTLGTLLQGIVARIAAESS